jgi:chemotaxis protein CheY-P-specific phosphatase CheC
MLKLREQLVAVEEDRMMGKKGFSIDEVDEMMKKAIKDAANEQRS